MSETQTKEITFNEKNTFVINIDKRVNRLKSCIQKLKSIGISFTRFSGIIPNIDQIKDDPIWNKSYQGITPGKCKKFKNYLKGSLGCKMSHYNVIKLAKDADLPYVIVFEDDIVLSENKDDMLKEIYNFINDNNVDWDIIYLGGKITGKTYETVNKYKHIKRVQCSLHTRGYILKKKMYPIVMSSFVKYNYECDNILQDIEKKLKLKVFYSKIVETTSGSSDIMS